MADAKTSTTVSVFGCLPLLFGLLVLGGLGFCGDSCQKDILDGIKAVTEATR